MRMMVRRRAAEVAAAMVVLWAGAAAGTTADTLTREAALAHAYPGATFTAERVFLTLEEQRRAAEGAGQPIASALVARYVATKDGSTIGRAYVDTHVVRTKKESLLISLDAAGAVQRVDAIAFLEPPEFAAPRAFLKQYTGKRLTGDLRVNRAIRPLAGATLTANATTHAVRRVLAIDAVLQTSRAGRK